MIQVTQNRDETSCHMTGTMSEIMAEGITLISSMVAGITNRNPIAGAMFCDALRKYTDNMMKTDFINAATGKTEFEKSETVRFDLEAIKKAIEQLRDDKDGEKEGGDK